MIYLCDSRNLEHQIRKLAGIKGECKYLALDSLSAGTESILEAKGFLKVKKGVLGEQQKRFMKEYIQLIGRLNVQQNNLLWWATDISSKNRFNSRLPFLFQQFLSVAETIKNERFDCLLILDAPWAVVSSLMEEFGAVYLNAYGNELQKWGRKLFSMCRRVFSVVWHSLRMLARGYYAKVYLRGALRDILNDDQPQYVIKSFVYAHSFSDNHQYSDVFFGHLPDMLKKREHVLIFVNILGNYKQCIQKIKACTDQRILPFEIFLSWRDVVHYALRILFYKAEIDKPQYFWGFDVEKIVSNHLIETGYKIQPYQLLHYPATLRLARAVRIRMFLLTYENNPWERMCLRALRSEVPGAKIFGYQHNVVPQASANMFMSQEERALGLIPDKILTVGSEPKNIMEEFGEYAQDDIESSCILRFNLLLDEKASPKGKIRNVLLGLEGIPEVRYMVDYVLKELKGDPAYQITIRTHPVLPWRYFERKWNYAIDAHSNVRISNGRTLREDLSAADVLVYWGSTVALEALCMSKPVIHFDVDSILSYDPLFKCDALKWTVTKDQSLKKVLEEIDHLSAEEFDVQQRRARAYLGKYFHPINDENIEKFISSAMSSV